MRAPPESLRPISGAPIFAARSMILTILAGLALEHRPAENRKVLGKDEDQPSFNASVAGDEAVAVELLLGHAEIVRAMGDQFVGLLAGPLIEQKLDPPAGRHFAFLMLPLAALLPAAFRRQAVALLQFFQLLFQIHLRT